MPTRVPLGYYLPDGQEPTPTPKRKARKPSLKPSEASIQVAIVRFLRLQLPGAQIHASPGGAHLAGEREGRSIAMAKLKAAGMRVGWPDLEVVWKGQFWFFEVKKHGGKVSEAQAEVGAALERNGARWAVVRSVDEVAEAIRTWRGDM